MKDKEEEWKKREERSGREKEEERSRREKRRGKEERKEEAKCKERRKETRLIVGTGGKKGCSKQSEKGKLMTEDKEFWEW